MYSPSFASGRLRNKLIAKLLQKFNAELDLNLFEMFCNENVYTNFALYRVLRTCMINVYYIIGQNIQHLLHALWKSLPRTFIYNIVSSFLCEEARP